MTTYNSINEAGWNLDNSYARLPQSFYTLLESSPVPSPEIIVFNHKLADLLGLDCASLDSKEGAAIFGGNALPRGSIPLAQAYAGHQFGYLNMLGDGRACLLGEQLTPDGDRFDIQLKGSGRTPYSRGGDGRAALGPMLREYIISEAMHGLRIPTTRSLAVVTTGEYITREAQLQGAVLARVAASHIRVGTFQYASKWCTIHELRAIADYTIHRHYPDAAKNEQPYLVLLQEVIKRQASLIAQWQLVGFIHGVMNTDNMTLSGETIDYGPCAFMDIYDPETVFSSIDLQGRYAYVNQPYIGAWNLARLAEALLPLLHEDEEQAIKLAEAEIARFMTQYEQHWLTGMRSKLGIFNEEVEDEALIETLMKLMQEHQADYTNTFKALTTGRLEELALHDTRAFRDWHASWQARLLRQPQTKQESEQLMRSRNPAIIPRNHRVEEALEAATESGDLHVMQKLVEALADPFAYSEEQEAYAELPPDNACPYRTFCGT